MSRIEEALKRARAREAGAPGPVPVPPPEPAAGAPGEAFKAPWEFQPAEFDQRAEPAGDASVPPPSEAVPPSSNGGRAALSRDVASHTHHRPKAPPGVGGTMAVFQGFDPAVVEKIVSTSSAPATSVEQFRRLAGTLHHAQVERNVKVVMVTSALASEGKTLTATNLALTLSESYRRDVLLIDGDLRRPTLHEVFRVPNVSGLGDGLKAEAEEKLSVIRISPNLSLLTAGRPDPDPMSGLTSDRMRRVIEEAAARFDWVIVDTPPVGLLPDANLLAAMVDVALLVVKAGGTPYPFVQRAVEAISRDKIIGIVLNQVHETTSFGGYQYYRYYKTYGKRYQ